MVLHFNVKGESRKAMVTAIEKEIGGKARYLGVPSCAYEIGSYTVGRNGELEFGDFDDIDEVADIIPDIKGHKSDEQDEDGFTIAMILAINNIDIPKEWEHKPEL